MQQGIGITVAFDCLLEFWSLNSDGLSIYKVQLQRGLNLGSNFRETEEGKLSLYFRNICIFNLAAFQFTYSIVAHSTTMPLAIVVASNKIIHIIITSCI